MQHKNPFVRPPLKVCYFMGALALWMSFFVLTVSCNLHTGDAAGDESASLSASSTITQIGQIRRMGDRSLEMIFEAPTAQRFCQKLEQMRTNFNNNTLVQTRNQDFVGLADATYIFKTGYSNCSADAIEELYTLKADVNTSSDLLEFTLDSGLTNRAFYDIPQRSSVYLDEICDRLGIWDGTYYVGDSAPNRQLSGQVYFYKFEQDGSCGVGSGKFDCVTINLGVQDSSVDGYRIRESQKIVIYSSEQQAGTVEVPSCVAGDASCYCIPDPVDPAASELCYQTSDAVDVGPGLEKRGIALRRDLSRACRDDDVARVETTRSDLLGFR